MRWPGGDRPKPVLSRQELRAQHIAGVGSGLKHKGCGCQIEGERDRIKIWEQNLLLGRELRQSGDLHRVVSTYQPGESRSNYLLLHCLPETKRPPRRGKALCSPVGCWFLC